MDLDALLGFGVFEDELGAGGNPLGKDDHRAADAHRVGKALDGIRLASHVRDDGHAQQDPLSAAALFGGGLAVQGGARPVCRCVPQVGSGFAI